MLRERLILIVITSFLIMSCEKNSENEFPSTVTDTDGNVYNTVKIGNQVWLSENLKTTTYNDGSPISYKDGIEWGSFTEGTYRNLYDKLDYVDTVGRLYNWAAVKTKKLCPQGWHVPTIAEWDELKAFLEVNGYGYEGSGDDIAKSIAGIKGWQSSKIPGSPGLNQEENNSSGFNGVPSGGYSYSNSWFYKEFQALWWSSTESNSYNAYVEILRFCNETIYRSNEEKVSGYCVRCLKD